MKEARYTSPSKSATCARCGAWRGVLGLEPLHDCLGWARGETCSQCYICHMRTVARGLWRVLRDDGSLWVNISDSYNSGTSAVRKSSKNVEHGYWENGGTMGDQRVNVVGLAPKNRVGIPERLALALQSDGWTWRDSIHLCKAAPMPESVTDRTTQAHENLFLFTKRARYYWDQTAVREDSIRAGDIPGGNYAIKGLAEGVNGGWAGGVVPTTRNPRSWMLVTPEPNGLQHYATFVGGRLIPRFAIRAGSSEYGVCAECGAPWERTINTEYVPVGMNSKAQTKMGPEGRDGNKQGGGSEESLNRGRARPQDLPYGRATRVDTFLGWRPTCKHSGSPIPATIFDPFSGSGTTQVVARELGRRSIYCDLSETYAEMAIKRMEHTTPMLPLTIDRPATLTQAPLLEVAT